MPDAAYNLTGAPQPFEALAICPDKTLDRDHSFDVLLFDLGGGYEPEVLTGHSEGTLEISFAFSHLTNTVSGSLILEDGTLITRALYFADFMKRHKSAGRAFFIKEPLTGRDILVKLQGKGYKMQRTENEMIWRAQITVRQWRAPGLVIETDDVSMSSGNPLSI